MPMIEARRRLADAAAVADDRLEKFAERRLKAGKAAGCRSAPSR
jgi:hypothetical protein